MTAHDDLVARARANAEAGGGGSEWGMRRQLEVGDVFDGRYRGETMSPPGEYGEQRLFLFWDELGAEIYMRGHTSLAQEIDREQPSRGANVVVFRSDDVDLDGGRTVYRYGVASSSSDEPLPGPTELGDDDAW